MSEPFEGKYPNLPNPDWNAVKDSGTRREFATGSRRDAATGKGRYDLLPTRALRRLAIHFENGAKKYGDSNWKKGQPLSVFMDSALRHMCKHLEGHRDEDHAAAAAWNIMCMIETTEMINEGILPVDLSDLPEELEMKKV